MKIELVEVPGIFTVGRLAPTDKVPESIQQSVFVSVTRTEAEISIVCEERHLPGDVKQEGSWKMLKVAGTLDFSLTGILSAITEPLAKAGISLFAISTFDTDYILVKADHFKHACRILDVPVNAGRGGE